MQSGRLVAFGLLVAGVGCVKDDLVECGDGRVCPTGTMCDLANQTCIDPRGLTVPAGGLDFASVGCGDTESLVLPVANFGVSPVAFEATSTVADVTVTPARGVVEPGQQLDLTVTATPASGTIPGVAVEGSIVLSTPFELLARPVRLVTVGTLITADDTVDFGETSVTTPVNRTLTIKNMGNVATQVSVGNLGSAFSVGTAGVLDVEAMATRTIDVRFEPGGVVQTAQASASLAFTGSHCQPAPTAVELSARSTGDPILASHTLLDFGFAACGAEAVSQQLTLTSQLGAMQTLSTAVTGDAQLFVTPQAASTLPAGPGGTAQLQIQRRALGMRETVGTKTAVLSVSAAPSNTVKTITLTHEIRAPVLAIDRDMLLVPDGAIGMVEIRNTGTSVATVTVSPSEYTFGGSRVFVTPTSFFVNPGNGKTFVAVGFQYAGGILPTGSLRFTFNAAGQCSTPPTLDVTPSPGIISP